MLKEYDIKLLYVIGIGSMLVSTLLIPLDLALFFELFLMGVLVLSISSEGIKRQMSVI